MWELFKDGHFFIYVFKITHIQKELFQDCFHCLLGKRRTSSAEEACNERSSAAIDCQDLLECAVCHEILCNPCRLACEHSFCKECIDLITKFKENLITLTCPLCEKEQVIENDFCNLKPSRLLKEMLGRTKGYFFQNLSNYSKIVFLKSFRYTYLSHLGANNSFKTFNPI